MPGEVSRLRRASYHSQATQHRTITQENYLQQNNLHNPNPTLLLQPEYQITSSDEESESDDDDLYSHTSSLIQIKDEDYLTTDDDIMVDDDDEDTIVSFKYDCHQINPKPISNIFMHHPHFNSKNKEYQYAMNTFIEQTTSCLTMGNEKCPINIPMRTITVPAIDLNNNQTNITAAADNGSDIQAIGINAILRYKEQGLIRTDKNGIIIGTGNGKVHVRDYVLLTVLSRNGKKYTTKFWCLESLPTYDYLIGRTLLYQLGWEMRNRYHTWEHKPTNIDHIDEELEELLCTRYPWKGEPEIDIDTVKIDNPELRPFIRTQLQKYKNVIAKHEWDSGTLKNIPEFEIRFVQEPHPYKAGFISKEYWTNEHHYKEVKRQIAGLKDHRLIKKCTQLRYVSPIFCVAKKTGDVRIVFDYRKLNEITEKFLFPIPEPRKLLNKFQGKHYITSLDLKGGYWHVPIKPEDRHKTAFIFDGDVWEWNVMPFGPTNAPMYFQKAMQEIFGHLDFVTVYLDDISILSETLEQHKQHLKIVFDLLNRYCIKLRLDKCLWGVQETEYLGFIVDKLGIKCKESYVRKIMNVPRPTNKTGLKRFLGLVQFLHSFIPQLHQQISILAPLTSVRKPDKIIWNDNEILAFDQLKEMVQSVKPLTHPDMTKPFHVFTDASKNGLGGMLAQAHDGKMQPVAYCSKVFSETQQNWHVSEQEVYAAIYCVEKWSHLLRHRKFTLHTDHKNLQKLFNTAVNFKSGKLFRWAVRLQDYHFECKYIRGIDNVVADYLSRESVLVQQAPEYKNVKRFYDASTITNNNIYNKNRVKHSNAGGVDILKLYRHHLRISILNQTTNAHYFDHYDPYQMLNNTPNTNNKRKSNSLSPKSYEFLNISSADQQIMLLQSLQCHNHNYDKDKITKTRYHCNPMAVDEVSSGSDTEEEQYIQQAKRLPSLQPYKQPVDNHNKKTVTDSSLRRSARLQGKYKVKPRHIPLKINNTEPYTGKQLKYRKIYQQREQNRQTIKNTNAKIINNKPYEHAWNHNIFDYRNKNYMPIPDNYDEIFDESYQTQIKLIRYKQWSDPICFNITNFLSTGNKALIADLPKYIQRYVLSGRFILDKYKILNFRHGTTNEMLKVVPPPLLISLLKYVHSNYHHGADKMILTIINKMKYWWPKMREHIKIFCKCCNTCQHIKPGESLQYKWGKMQLFAATKPFEQISVDIVGPLPTTYSNNRYIVTMIDKFSRYVMLIPTTDITALSVIKAIDKWITTFGPPKSILSDNGPQFISNMYKDYMKNHKKIKYKYTTTYHPQCNGQIERLHRWIKERLALIAYDEAKNFVDGTDDWSEYLPIIQYTYNSTPNKMTTYSPMDIVLGVNDYEIDEYIFDPENPKEYIDYLANRQAVLKYRANERQTVYDKIRLNNYKNKKKIKQYQVGDKVLWNASVRFSGNKRKLGPRWVGPYEIIKIFNNGQSYKIKEIPLPIFQRDNPMNKHAPPKRADPQQPEENIVTEYYVPREQIKPYFESYEIQFDGIQSPIELSINVLTNSINQTDTTESDKTQIYQILFQMYNQQISMGYIPAYDNC